ncbi:MAG: hypothetical protein GY737_31535 [Desulfobacteraceae bacterium]|nr:hypothetical protein [Desulfobacteraceae bacterium]
MTSPTHAGGDESLLNCSMRRRHDSFSLLHYYQLVVAGYLTLVVALSGFCLGLLLYWTKLRAPLVMNRRYRASLKFLWFWDMVLMGTSIGYYGLSATNLVQSRYVFDVLVVLLHPVAAVSFTASVGS